MTPPEPTVVYVRWQELLDIHQGVVAADVQMRAWLILETGEVTCRLFLGDRFDELEAQRRILEIPVKPPREHLAQRRYFAESCCDDGLRTDLIDALDSDSPFVQFDRTLAAVPIEATRWREAQREEDQLALERWLVRAGVRPEPPAVIKRTVIEFPRRPKG